MFKQLTLAAVLAALPAVAAASDSPGDTPPGRQRVTIRGTGSSVEIERTEASARKQPRPAAEPAGVLDQAADLKARGASDAAVVDYLHAHQASLPPIIEARDIRALRKAGAGQSVVTWLTTVAAVDIGETGEGHEAVVSAAPPSAESEGFPYGQPYAWGADGGYGMPYYFSSGSWARLPSASSVPSHARRWPIRSGSADAGSPGLLGSLPVARDALTAPPDAMRDLTCSRCTAGKPLSIASEQLSASEELPTTFEVFP